MDKSTFDYISETVDRLYNKLEDAFTLQFSDEEIHEFKEKIEHLDAKLEQMDALNCLIVDVHNEIVDLQQFLASNKPPKEEEEEEKVEGLKHLKVEIPSSDSIPNSDSSSADSTESTSKYEKLPFSFLRNISHSAYTRYYNAYKEAKTIVQKFQEENPGEFVWEMYMNKITAPVPDAVTLYANLKGVYDLFDTVELTRQFGKEFVRFYKLLKRMLMIAETYASKQRN